MGKLARIGGVIWMAAAVLAGIVLLGGGVMAGRSLPIYLVFGAALPGILAYRWGRGLRQIVPAREAKMIRAAPIRLIDTAHELKLTGIPSGPAAPPGATPSHPCATRPRP